MSMELQEPSVPDTGFTFVPPKKKKLPTQSPSGLLDLRWASFSFNEPSFILFQCLPLDNFVSLHCGVIRDHMLLKNLILLY